MSDKKEGFIRMKAEKIAALVTVIVLVGIAAFHIGHYVLYCRYRNDPQKSHCSSCGHRKICKKKMYKSGR